MDKEEIAAMTAEQRKSFLTQVRMEALDDHYQPPTMTHRHRMLDEWNASIPTKAERDERRAAQIELEREADIVARRVENVEARRAEREHEVRVAKIYANASANGNNGTVINGDVVDALSTLGEALNNILARVEGVEQRLDKLETANQNAVQRMDIAQLRTQTEAERVENNLKDTINTIKTDVGFLRFRLDLLATKRQQQPQEQHIIVHSSS
jgi:hypothetical protein